MQPLFYRLHCPSDLRRDTSRNLGPASDQGTLLIWLGITTGAVLGLRICGPPAAQPSAAHPYLGTLQGRMWTCTSSSPRDCGAVTWLSSLLLLPYQRLGSVLATPILGYHRPRSVEWVMIHYLLGHHLQSYRSFSSQLGHHPPALATWKSSTKPWLGYHA